MPLYIVGKYTTEKRKHPLIPGSEVKESGDTPKETFIANKQRPCFTFSDAENEKKN
jgi:hypothetical protein